ncbi:MAG: manganese efflux pump MntP family protein [Candidatus Bathyarchaeota archaeon]|nr:manganese efflux pump MntP family protein [Candidatus Bathyarchaeum sp.]
MDVTTIFIAVALAMDSFSVAIANGLATKTFKITKAIKISVFFGFFQAIMPIIGWYAGVHVLDLISEFDHWVAFILLTFIGCRMIYESIKQDPNSIIKSYSIKVLVILSIATSIDALAVGLSVSILTVSIITLATVTGVVTFMLSFFGVYLGGRFGCILQNRVESLGGIILIVIGLRILLEHLGII